MKTPHTRTPMGGKPWLVLSLPVAILAAAATAWVYFGDNGAEAPVLDADLCPGEARVAGRSAFLVDLTKPVDGDAGALARGLLDEVLAGLGRGDELRVYLLNGSADAPRSELGRLCKPFADADLGAATKDYGAAAARGCDELPAQLTPEVRELATRFCALGEGLGERLGRAASEASLRTVAGRSHLVEALEDLRIEMAERPSPQTLYVLSDMMQHASWFSHLDLPWQRWSHAELSRLREAQGWPPSPPATGLRVELFYLPRAGSTDQPRIRQAHRRFWREYFSGASVAFREQSPMRGYRASSLMGVPTAEEVAANAMREVEAMLSEVRREQERINEERERLLAEQEALRQEQEARRRASESVVEAPVSPAPERPEAERAVSARPDTGRPDPEPAARPADEPPPVAAEPRPEVAMAAGDASAGGGELPAAVQCELTLTPAAEGLTPAYPRGGRTNFGEASVAIRYVVDERGETVDDEVQVIAEESSAQRERYLRLFVESATAVVRQWTFDTAGTDACTFPVERAATFDFTYW